MGDGVGLGDVVWISMLAVWIVVCNPKVSVELEGVVVGRRMPSCNSGMMFSNVWNSWVSTKSSAVRSMSRVNSAV